MDHHKVVKIYTLSNNQVNLLEALTWGHISHARGHGARTRRLNIYDTYHTGGVRPGLRDSGMVPAGMRPALVFPERSQLPIGYDVLD